MKIVLVALASAALGWAAQAGVRKASTYADETYRFSIQAPGFPKAPRNASVIPVMMFAPADGEYTANVQVTVQQVSLKLEEYRQALLDQFKRSGWKVNSESRTKASGRDALLFDYEGPYQGRELRWLALALVDKDRAFLLTATASRAGFVKVEKEFKSCFDSFKLAE